MTRVSAVINVGATRVESRPEGDREIAEWSAFRPSWRAIPAERPMEVARDVHRFAYKLCWPAGNVFINCHACKRFILIRT